MPLFDHQASLGSEGSVEAKSTVKPSRTVSRFRASTNSELDKENAEEEKIQFDLVTIPPDDLVDLRLSLIEGGDLQSIHDIGEFLAGGQLLAGGDLNFDALNIVGLQDGDEIDPQLHNIALEALAALADDGQEVQLAMRPPNVVQEFAEKAQREKADRSISARLRHCCSFLRSSCRRRKWRRRRRCKDRFHACIVSIEARLLRLIFGRSSTSMEKRYDIFLASQTSDRDLADWIIKFCENRSWAVFAEPPCEQVRKFLKRQQDKDASGEDDADDAYKSEDKDDAVSAGGMTARTGTSSGSGKSRQSSIPCLEWLKRRQVAVRASSALIVILSHECFENAFVIQDCVWAYTNGIPILPVCRQDCPPDIPALKRHLRFVFGLGLGVPSAGIGANRHELFQAISRAIVKGLLIARYAKSRKKLPAGAKEAFIASSQRLQMICKQGKLEEFDHVDDELEAGDDEHFGDQEQEEEEEEQPQQEGIEEDLEETGSQNDLMQSARRAGLDEERVTVSQLREAAEAEKAEQEAEMQAQREYEARLERLSLGHEERVFGIIAALALHGSHHKQLTIDGVDALRRVSRVERGCKTIAEFSGTTIVMRCAQSANKTKGKATRRAKKVGKVTKTIRSVKSTVRNCLSRVFGRCCCCLRKHHHHHHHHHHHQLADLESQSRCLLCRAYCSCCKRGGNHQFTSTHRTTERASEFDEVPSSRLGKLFRKLRGRRSTKVGQWARASLMHHGRFTRFSTKSFSHASHLATRFRNFFRGNAAKHLEAIGIADNSLACLRNLACRSAERKLEILDAGGALIAVKAMKVFADVQTDGVKKSAAGLLRNLSAEQARGPPILYTAGVLAVAREELAGAEVTTDTERHLLAIVQNMAAHPDAPVSYFRGGDSERWLAICAQVVDHARDEKATKILQQALSALANLARVRTVEGQIADEELKHAFQLGGGTALEAESAVGSALGSDKRSSRSGNSGTKGDMKTVTTDDQDDADSQAGDGKSDSRTKAAEKGEGSEKPLSPEEARKQAALRATAAAAAAGELPPAPVQLKVPLAKRKRRCKSAGRRRGAQKSKQKSTQKSSQKASQKSRKVSRKSSLKSQKSLKSNVSEQSKPGSAVAATMGWGSSASGLKESHRSGWGSSVESLADKPKLAAPKKKVSDDKQGKSEHATGGPASMRFSSIHDADTRADEIQENIPKGDDEQASSDEDGSSSSDVSDGKWSSKDDSSDDSDGGSTHEDDDKNEHGAESGEESSPEVMLEWEDWEEGGEEEEKVNDEILENKDLEEQQLQLPEVDDNESLPTDTKEFDVSLQAARDKVPEKVLASMLLLLSEECNHHQASATSALTVAATIAALCNFAQDVDVERSIGALDGLETVLKTMIAFNDNQVHLQGLRFFLNMSFSHHNQERLLMAGVLPFILTLLQTRREETDAEIQEQGCGVLRNLATGPPKQKSQIFRQGATAMLVRTLQDYPHHSGACRQAASALRILADGAPPVADEVCNADGMAALISALRKTGEDSDLTDQVLHAMEFVLVSPMARRPFIKAMGHLDVLQSMERFPNENTVLRACRTLAGALCVHEGFEEQDLSESEEEEAADEHEEEYEPVLAQAKRGASTAAAQMKKERDELKKRKKEEGPMRRKPSFRMRLDLAEQGAIEKLCHHLGSFLGHLDVLSAVVGAIRNLMLDLPGMKNMHLKQAVGMKAELLLRTVSYYVDKVDLRSSAMRFVGLMLTLLASLALNKEAAVLLHRQGAAEKALEWMALYSNDAVVQCTGCAFLKNFSASQLRIRAEIVECGGVKQVSELLNRYMGNKKVLEEAIRALHNFAMADGCGEEAAENLVVRRVFTALHHHSNDHELHAAGYALLWNISTTNLVAAAIFVQDGVKKALDAISTFDEHPAVIGNACGMVRNLLAGEFCEQVSDMISGKRSYNILLNPLRRHADSALVAEQLLGCLSNIAMLKGLHLEIVARELMNTREAEALLNLLEGLQESAAVQYQGFSLISRLVAYDRELKPVFNCVVPHALQMLVTHGRTPVVDMVEACLEEVG